MIEIKKYSKPLIESRLHEAKTHIDFAYLLIGDINNTEQLRKLILITREAIDSALMEMVNNVRK